MLRSALLTLACAALVAQAPDPFAPVRFLAGEWVGEGQPGQGSGGFTFAFELDGKAMVRRSTASYPAANGRPAVRHEDLMTVFAEGDRLKAFYLDNEGHVIRYTVTQGDGVVFLSDDQAGPRFRLTYKAKAADLVSVAFAIAPPGGAFATYVEGDCRRKK